MRSSARSDGLGSQYLSSRDAFLGAPSARLLPRFRSPFGSRLLVVIQDTCTRGTAGSPKGHRTLGGDRRCASGTPARLETLGIRPARGIPTPIRTLPLSLLAEREGTGARGSCDERSGSHASG